MSFTQNTDDMNVIAALADRPALTATQLKAKFDYAAGLLKTYLNSSLIAELEDATAGSSGASNIGVGAVNVTAANVEDAISELRAAISQVTLGQISDNSITNAKLVTDAKIGSLAALTTTEKSSLQAAINELVTSIGTVAGYFTTYPSMVFYGRRSQMSGGASRTSDGVVTFDTEDVDDFSAIDIGTAPTKITIPAGISEVKFYAYLDILSTISTTTITVRKDGSTTAATLLMFGDTSGDDVPFKGTVYSLPVSVSEGDYYELYFDETTEATLNAGTIFGIEVVG